MHHMNVKIFCKEAQGWFILSRVIIISDNELHCCTVSSVLMYQCDKNQAALTKGQVKKRCTSSSCIPHLQQVFSICLENLPALAPVGSAFRRKRQANVWILGIISLHFHTCFNNCIVCWEGISGRCSCSCSYKICKQA